MPKYAGRYPIYCPSCGTSMNADVTTSDQNPNTPVMEDSELRKLAFKMNVLMEADNPSRLLKDEDDLAVAKDLAMRAKKGCSKSQNKLSSMLNDENDYNVFVRETVG